jgi:hypothetical protein
MFKSVAFVLWLAGAAQGFAATDPGSTAAPGKAVTGEPDIMAVQYREAEPVIEYAERTRPRAVPVTTDRYRGIKEFLVNFVLAITAVFSAYLILHYRQRYHGESAGASLRANRAASRERNRPKTAKPAAKLPGTPFEQACRLKELRAVHAAEIERLYRRI